MHEEMGLSLGHKDPANGYTPKEKSLSLPQKPQTDITASAGGATSPLSMLETFKLA